MPWLSRRLVLLGILSKQGDSRSRSGAETCIPRAECAGTAPSRWVLLLLEVRIRETENLGSHLRIAYLACSRSEPGLGVENWTGLSYYTHSS